MAICNHSGTIAIYDSKNKNFFSPLVDGPIKYSPDNKMDMNGVKMTKFGKEFSIVEVPYCFKLLLQELSSMNIQMRLITNENIHEMNLRNSIKYNDETKDEEMTAMNIEIDQNNDVTVSPQDSFNDRMNKHPKIDPWVYDEENNSYNSIIIDTSGKPTEIVSAEDERLEGLPPMFLPKGWNENDIIKYNISRYILTESLKINKIPNNWNIIIEKIRMFNNSNIPINKPIDLNEYNETEENINEYDDILDDDLIYAVKDIELNEPWIVKESNKYPGKYYFFNTQTKEIKWRMPYDIVKLQPIYNSVNSQQESLNDISPDYRQGIFSGYGAESPQMNVNQQNNSPKYTVGLQQNNSPKYTVGVQQNNSPKYTVGVQQNNSPEYRVETPTVNAVNIVENNNQEFKEIPEIPEKQSDENKNVILEDNQPLIIKKVNNEISN